MGKSISNNFQMKFSIRQAKISDVDFLIESMIHAEKFDTDIVSYCTLFEISQPIFVEQVKIAFIDGLDIFPWDCKHWLVATNEKGKLIAAMASWNEPEFMGTETKKFQFLCYLNKSKVQDSQFQHRFDLLKKMDIPREPNYIQLDFLYTHHDYRGKGIMSNMIKHVITKHLGSQFQIQVLGGNEIAKRLYERMGFVENKHIHLKGIKANRLLADDIKINMLLNG